MPSGIEGIGDEMDGAMQQAAHPAIQTKSLLTELILLKRIRFILKVCYFNFPGGSRSVNITSGNFRSRCLE